MLKTRVAAALVFAPALLALVYLGGLYIELTCFVLAMLMLWEFLQMTLGEGQPYAKAVGYLLGAAVAAAGLGWLSPSFVPLLPSVVVMGGAVAVLFNPLPLDAAGRKLAFLVAGAVYAAGLIPHLAALRNWPVEGLGFALMALFCTWGADTGAYFAGRLLGRRKLYPKISPGKTVEGAIGGLVVAVGMAYLLWWWLQMPTSPGLTLVIGAVGAAFGTAGDLCESMLKRSVGAKDSSNLIPGHGGVLDRFDGVMFAAPAIHLTVELAAGAG